MRLASRAFLIALLGVFLTAAANVLTNLASDQISVTSPQGRSAVWLAFFGVLGVIAFLSWRRSTTSLSGEPTSEAARQLHGVLVRAGRQDQVWKAVQDGGRLQVDWRPATRLFPSDRTPPRRAGKDRSDGERLASLWMAKGVSPRLVVLGQAGAGKTELLVGACYALLERWTPGSPVPILIPISEWNPETDVWSWLRDWVHAEHPYLRRPAVASDGTLAEALLEGGRLALVLDGFDELTRDSRVELLRQLNRLRTAGDAPQRVLLSSRTADYASVAGAGDIFTGARGVVITPLRREQAVDYLSTRSPDAGRWAPVAEALAGRKDLRRLLRTPLMVALADAIYNQAPGASGKRTAHPAELLSVRGASALTDHVLAAFIPSQYPPSTQGSAHKDTWSADHAQRWLGYLALKLGQRIDLRWWDLPMNKTEDRRSLLRDFLLVLVIAIWTALSAGLFNGWAFDSLRTGVTDAIRISAGTVVCYLAVRRITGSRDHGTMGAVGAYIAGTPTGSLDLAIAIGLITGFSWRRVPASERSARLRYPVMVGLAATAVSVVTHLVGRAVGLEAALTRGFGAGALDGFSSRWDDELTGWMATGIAAAAFTWMGAAGIRRLDRPPPRTAARDLLAVMGSGSFRWRGETEPPLRSGGPVLYGLITGILVLGISTLLQHLGQGAGKPLIAPPADALAAGLTVWWAAWSTRRGRRSSTVRSSARPSRAAVVSFASAILLGLATLGFNVVAYATRRDIHSDWWRALADGIAVSILIAVTVSASTRGHKSDSVRRPASLLKRASYSMAVWAAALTVGGLDAVSAGAAHGVATALSVVIILRSLTTRTVGNDGMLRLSPVGLTHTAARTIMTVGLLAGFGYALLFGVVASLAARLSSEIGQRLRPSLRLLPSASGIAGGLLLGAVVALAAAYNRFPLLSLVIVGVTSAAAGSFAFGVTGAVPSSTLPYSPYSLFRRDRAAFISIAGLVASSLGIAVGARTAAAGASQQIAIYAAACSAVTYGATAGVVVAAAATRYGTYVASVARLVAAGHEPRNLMPFLNDAHTKRHVLRAYGAAYRFRHQRLQARMAEYYRQVDQSP